MFNSTGNVTAVDTVKLRKAGRITQKGGDRGIIHAGSIFIPEPCRVPDVSEIGQGSGKKPDNDVVC